MMKVLPLQFIKMNEPIQIFSAFEETFIDIYNAEFFNGIYDDSVFKKYNIPSINKLHEISIKERLNIWLVGL
ncbi:hypothetical protein [Gilliamella sp. ESL0254]|uniref:hypothetical protein n=1 Tax=Gilliamella sp. ESL0254 TaxID=2705035 RepID=UPI001EEA5DA5|nr:hypothetical protein [Gilliamella sp. ESL0254]